MAPSSNDVTYIAGSIDQENSLGQIIDEEVVRDSSSPGKNLMKFGSYLQRFYKNKTRERYRREKDNSEIIHDDRNADLVVTEPGKFRGNTSLDHVKKDTFKTKKTLVKDLLQ